MIAPGRDVYVLGHAEAREDPERTSPEDAVVTEPEDGLLAVSDQDEASLEAEFGSAARARFAAGTVATVLGTAGLVYVLPI